MIENAIDSKEQRYAKTKEREQIGTAKSKDKELPETTQVGVYASAVVVTATMTCWAIGPAGSSLQKIRGPNRSTIRPVKSSTCRAGLLIVSAMILPSLVVLHDSAVLDGCTHKI